MSMHAGARKPKSENRFFFIYRPNRHRGVIVQLAGRVEGGGDGTIGVSIRAAQPGK